MTHISQFAVMDSFANENDNELKEYQVEVITFDWRKRSIPTHSNGSIHSLLSPKIGLRSA